MPNIFVKLKNDNFKNCYLWPAFENKYVKYFNDIFIKIEGDKGSLYILLVNYQHLLM